MENFDVSAESLARKSFAALLPSIERLSESTIRFFYLYVVGVTCDVAWEPLCVKIEDIGGNLQNLGELLDNRIFRRITAVVLQII